MNLEPLSDKDKLLYACSRAAAVYKAAEIAYRLNQKFVSNDHNADEDSDTYYGYGRSYS